MNENFSADRPCFRLLGSIEQKWIDFSPNQTIRYSFPDQEFESMYNDTRRMGTIILNSTFLAIFIACLGLVALSQLTIKNRTKESGIRKINGAKVSELLTMLNKGFIKWVFVAFIVIFQVNLISRLFEFITTMKKTDPDLVTQRQRSSLAPSLKHPAGLFLYAWACCRVSGHTPCRFYSELNPEENNPGILTVSQYK